MTDYPSAQLVLAHLLYEDHDGSWSLDELARELRFGPSSSRTPPRRRAAPYPILGGADRALRALRDSQDVSAISESPPRRALRMALAEARVEGRPQWRVSADADIDPSVFSRILLGKFEPSRAQVEAIAASLGRPVAYLFPEHGRRT